MALISKNTVGIVLTLLVMSAVMHSGSAKASAGSLDCKQQHGPGAAFFNFNKLVIYYTELPRKADQAKLDFPDILRADHFKQTVYAAVLNNFKNCLPAEMPGSSLAVTSAPTDEVFDSRNVVLLIRLSWPHQIDKNDPHTRYAILQTQVFRNGLSAEDDLSSRLNTHAFALFPSMGTPESLESQLDASLRIALQPFQYGTGIPGTEDGVAPSWISPNILHR